MTTNAQAALQAAATIYGGSHGNVSVETVAGLASMLKRSLDKADRDDAAAWKAPKPTRTLGDFPHGEPSHHCRPSCKQYRPAPVPTNRDLSQELEAFLDKPLLNLGPDGLE